MSRLLLFFLVVLSKECLAQINDSIHHYVNFTSSGVVNKTNDRIAYVLNNDLRFTMEKKRISLNTGAHWIFGEQNHIKTNNDFLASVDFNVYEKREHARFYYWGLSTYETSFSLKLNHRIQTGAGVGYHILEKQNARIIVSDGVLFEKTDLYELPELQSNDYETLRNSFRIKFRWSIQDKVILEGTDFIQHALNNRSDYIIKSNTRISVRLLRWLNFSTNLTYNKLSLTGRENLLLNYGLTFERYF